MEFKERFNYYLDTYNISLNDIHKESNISLSVLSRYKSGARNPKYESEQFQRVVDAIYKILKKNKVAIIKEDISNDLSNTLKKTTTNEYFNDNLNNLINALSINASNLAKYMSIDSSYLSKIRNNSRKPQNLDEFISSISSFIISKYNDDESKKIVARLLDIKIDTLNSNIEYEKCIKNYLLNSPKNDDNAIDEFLNNLDNFDLNDYLTKINFENIKIPTAPINLPKSKNYFGLKGYQNSQIDLIKKLVTSKKTGDLYFFSNMPMEKAGEDAKFTKKFMFGLAMCLKKGYHLNMIHNLNRPFNEIMMGLNGWIPLYMTGQISPYYFKNDISDFYTHILVTSDNAILCGEAINKSLENSRYYITNNKKEIKIFKNNMESLIKKASPLMNIYTEDNAKEFNDMINKKTINHNILCNLPLYTISIDLLNKILDKNKVPREDGEKIVNYYMSVKNNIEKYLKDNTLVDEITLVSKDDFENRKIGLSLSNIFYDKKIVYSYEDYVEHYKQTDKFKKEHKNYTYKIINQGFNNINIHFTNDDKVIISKENVPSIHFLIFHPKLIEGLSNFSFIIKEK